MPELHRFPLTVIESRNVPPVSAGAQPSGWGLPFPHVFVDRFAKLSFTENAVVTSALVLSTTWTFICRTYTPVLGQAAGKPPWSTTTLTFAGAINISQKASAKTSIGRS